MALEQAVQIDDINELLRKFFDEGYLLLMLIASPLEVRLLLLISE